VARESLVLLKNDGSLPLALNASMKRVAVVGPSANDSQVILGNYQGNPSTLISVLQGVQNVTSAAGIAVEYAEGCNGRPCPDYSQFASAVSAAQGADAIIAVMGLDQTFASEGLDW
jgi:hypothetical protein